MYKALVAALLGSALLPAAAALADPPPWAPAHGWRDHHGEDGQGEDEHDNYERRGERPHYYQERRLTAHDRIWRGNDGRYYCHRSDGTTGLIVGGAVGALAGRSLAGGGDRTLGTLVGMTGGALLGRAIDRGDLRCH
jgi:hypothetical protein